jgi:hypothetical protein
MKPDAKKPGAVSRPGTPREFQFPIYTDFAVRVKRNLAGRSAEGTLRNPAWSVFRVTPLRSCTWYIPAR